MTQKEEAMGGRKVVLTGRSLVVVWLLSYDSTLAAPKRVYDLYTNNDLLDDFSLTVNVEGKDMWILDKRERVVCLVRYQAQGGEAHYPVSYDLSEALRPYRDVPANVWARTVAEAHEAVCEGRGACACSQLRRVLDESGLLL